MMKNTEPLDTLQELLAQARARGADAADAVLIASSDIAVSQRMGKPEDIERAESTGIGLRVFCGTRVAAVSSTDLSRNALTEACERAVTMAKAATEDPYAALAESSRWPNAIPRLDLHEKEEPSLDWMREQCKILEDVALACEGITNSEGSAAQVSRNRIALASSEGFAETYQSGSCSLSISLLAGKGSGMQRDYDYSAARYSADLTDAETIARHAAERTLAKLNPQKVKSRQLPVIFDPRVGKSLLSNFASAINGQSIARGTSFLKEKMHQPIFAPGIRIIDDPHRPRGLGSRPFDAEGVANCKRAMVEDGQLKSWFLDLRSANQLGLETTGHAVRGLTSSPSPSSTNLYMEAGNVSPEELMADIQEGIYITEAFGMGVNLITGDYSQGASGFWIENGKRTYPVSEFTIAGHLTEMFAGLTPANDLVFDYSTNVPTLRLDRMTIAGT